MRRPMRHSGFSTCSSKTIKRSQGLPSPCFHGNGGAVSPRERFGSGQSGGYVRSDFTGYAETAVENVASARAIERAGFLREGLLRAHCKTHGRRHDCIIFSLVPEDIRHVENRDFASSNGESGGGA